MRRIHLIVPGILLAFTNALTLAAPPSESANKAVRYKWKDESGALHFSDIITPEAAKFGYDVVNGQGLVVKHVDRAKTPEELKIAQEEAQQKEQAKREAEEQAKADRQLLAAYPNEAILMDAQKAQLDAINQAIQSAESTLAAQEKSLTEHLNRAAELERDGKPVPANSSEQIRTLRTNITAQKALIARKQEEKVTKTKKLEDDLNHYRKLTTKTSGENMSNSSAK